MADVDCIRAATERAMTAMQAHRDAGPSILAETAPLYFPSRPAAPVPEYLQPDYVPREKARLIAMGDQHGLGDRVRERAP